MNTCVIFNPTARGEKARHFREHLADLSAECTLKPTTAAGAGRALAAEAVREGFETIVAAGGDGTVNEVVNGLGDEPEGFRRARLGVLPLGTVNVFARDLKIPAHLSHAWHVLRHGRETVLDLGEAACQSDGQPRRLLFVQMAGAGVDARAVELVDWQQKKRLGQIAYVIAGIKALWEAKPSITLTNGRQTVVGEQVLIGNGAFYGGSYRLFPRADPRDGLLEATVLARANLPTLLRGAWRLARGRLYDQKRILHLRGTTLDLTCSQRVSVEADGELVGQLPACFTVRPRTLRVVVP